MQPNRLRTAWSALLLLMLALFACSGGETGSGVCGNGALDSDEVCDAAKLDGESCESLGFGAGTLACAASCKDFDRTACGAPTTCKDGIKNGVELCDGEDLGGATCVSLDFGDGTLACADNCAALDTSGCGAPESCGNGKKDEAEACDGDLLGGATCASQGEGPGTVVCSADCLSIDTSGCECAPACGALKCGLDPKCSMSCGDCDIFSACQEGACIQVCDLAPIDADTVLDVDLPMFTLSGTVTLNGAMIPNDTDLDTLTRGEIEIRNVDTYDVITIDMKETGAVNYSLQIFAGTYDVFVHSSSSGWQTVLPNDQRALVMRGLEVKASGTQNFDLKMVTVAGKVTLNGVDMPTDADQDTLARGELLIRDVDTADEFTINFVETGPVTYSMKMFVGMYDVFVHSSSSGWQSVLPNDQRAVVKKGLPIQASGTQDFDLKMVTVAGKVTLNGADMPTDADQDTLSRGELLIRDVDTADEFTINFVETGPVTYSMKMFVGMYDIFVHSSSSGWQSVLPNDQRAVVKKGLPIQASGTQDFDLKMVTVAGKVTLNGADMPTDADQDTLSRGELLIRDVDTVDEFTINFVETGPVTYSMKMFVGTYDIFVHSSSSGWQSVLPNDQRAVVKKGLSIQASGTQDFDLKMVTVAGKVTLNGADMPTDADQDTLSRGELLIRDVDTVDEFTINFVETGPVMYSMKMFVGTYDIFVHSSSSGWQSVLPNDQRAVVKKGLSIQASGTQDFDLKMVTVSGKVTLNGAAMPTDADQDTLSRGELFIYDVQTADEFTIDFKETGPVTYSMKMFVGTYNVLVHSSSSGWQTVLPNDQRALIKKGCLPL